MPKLGSMLKSNAYNYIFNWGLIITCLHDAVVYWLSNLVTADSEINQPMNNYPPRISDKNCGDFSDMDKMAQHY